MHAILECHDIGKVYGAGPLAERVLSGVSCSMRRGEACALLGPSGSGKTTLLSILGCLLSPTAGVLRIDGKQVDHAARGCLTELRRTVLGFVFQQAQLLPFLSMGDNLRIVGRNAGLARSFVEARITCLGARLGIADLLVKKPHLASTGQRQRVSIARALLHQPPIVLADEPTAALDWETGRTVIELLAEQARRENALLVTVTHDVRVLDVFDRVFHLERGRLVER